MPGRILMPSLRTAPISRRPVYRATVSPSLRRSLASLPNLPLFRALHRHDPSSVAVVHSASSRTFTYGNLNADVLRAQDQLLQTAKGGKDELVGERVAFLAENSYDYVGTVSLSLIA